jgi:glycosyltransferase involved in cell wall biosynthesis
LIKDSSGLFKMINSGDVEATELTTGPFFSICIPCFNHGRYLGETISSVLEQDFDDFEVLVADNASTDNSKEVARSFGDSRIQLLENRYNIGFAPNLQRVTETAKGKFMILLSSDDLMRPGALSQYHRILTDQGSRAEQTVMFSATEVINQNGELTHVKCKKPGEIKLRQVAAAEPSAIKLDGSLEVSRGKDVLRRALVEVSYPAVFCATVYPRSLWLRVEGYDTRYHYMPDAAFLHKLLALDPDFIYVNKCLFAYRVHDQNQDSQALAQGALRQQVDGYMRAVNYPQDVLDSIGLSREDVIRGFVDTLCVQEAVKALSDGSWLRAFKLMSFAMASYPKTALKIPRTYLAAGMVAAGPLGLVAGKLARQIKKRDGSPARSSAAEVVSRVARPANEIVPSSGVEKK